ncbi:MAG: aminotransferase class V-fold PLP-dependent enzyme [Omnitrophica WOR_2 bacterium]
MSTEAPTYLQIDRVREAFPVLKDIYYLNTGTYGIMPEPALAEFQTIQAEFESRGIGSNGTFGRKTEEARKRIAALIGAVPEEIAFTRNATDGINLVLAGIDWKPGDEVITTNEEHEAMNYPLLYLQNTKGIRVKFLEVSPKADVMLDRLEKSLSEKTRLVAMSMVSCETGTRLPAQAISKWAADQGLLCLFDGAQVSGALPINMREIGCDYYASNGHKWLSGPKGTGFFYGKQEKLGLLTPAHVGAGSLQKFDLKTGTAEPFNTGQRFEFGTRAWALTAGLCSSLDWFEGLGWKNVYGHIAALSDYLKEKIISRPYLQMLTPIPFEESSGLTTFIFKDHTAGDIGKELRENWKMPVRIIPHFNGIRISTAHFNNQDDIDCLMKALDEFYTREK